MSKICFALSDEMNVPLENTLDFFSTTYNEKQFERIVFVASKDILDFVSLLKDYHKKTYDEEINLNVLILNDLQNLDYIFERFKYKIGEFPDSDIIINYTNGSNKLSAVGIIIARLYGFKIQKRFEIEDISKINEFDVVEEKSKGSVMYIIKKSFNNNDFLLARDLLEEYYNNRDLVRQMFYEIIELYRKWDSFDYVEKNYDDLLEFFTNLEVLPKNIESLHILNDRNDKLYNSYKIADMINNAKRRIDEKNYNDAIIRLYRTLEYIVEVELYEKYGIRKNDVHVDELKELNIEKKALKKILERLDYKYPKYSISLTSSFFLLQKLYDDVGKHYYYNKDQYQQLFQKRNISILIHGNYTYNCEEAQKMYELVVSMAKVYDKSIYEYLKNTTFPKFKI